MGSLTTKIKYIIASAAGITGSQPYKAIAKMPEILSWKYTDKLNQLKVFTFEVPNDEFHRSNAMLERKATVPFVEKFTGFVTERVFNSNSITLTAHDYAWNFTKRLYSHAGYKRVLYTDKLWYHPLWTHRHKITIPKTLIADDIKDIPLRLRLQGGIGFVHAAQSTGNDFVFTTKDGQTKIPHGIENYNNTTGELQVWIRIPKVSDNTDIELYIYYGNEYAVNQEDTINVWKDAYTIEEASVIYNYDWSIVQHLYSDSVDVTENGNDGTDTAITYVDGLLGKAAQFDGVNSKIDFGSAATLDDVFGASGGGWLTFWINLNSDGEGSAGEIIGKGTWRLISRDQTNGYIRLRLEQDWDTAATTSQWDTGVVFALNTDYRIDVFYDNTSPANDPIIWINGEKLEVGSGLTETTAPGTTADSDAGNNLILGNNTGQTATIDGEIDEVRMLKGPPVDMHHIIQTGYKLETDPEELIVLGDQEHYRASVCEVMLDIIDHANQDMPAGVTWKLGDGKVLEVDNLLSLWRFDNTLNDSKSNNHLMLIDGNASYVTGKFNSGFDADGTTRLDAGDITQLNTASAFSFDFVWKPDSIDPVETIMEKRISDTNRIWVHTLATGQFRVHVANGTDSYGEIIDYSPEIDTTVFQNVSIIYDGSGIANADRLKIRINGIEKALNFSGTIPATTGDMTGANLYLFARYDGSENSNGVFDDVRYYMDALTLAESALIAEQLASGRNVIRNDIIPQADITFGTKFKDHWATMQEVARVCNCDVWFDNREYRVYMGVKGKIIDQQLDLTISSQPKTSLDNFANIVNVVGKKDGAKPTDALVQVDSDVQGNYEKVVSDNHIATGQQANSIATGLLAEFSVLTPSISATVPTDQFRRFDLQSGDVIKHTENNKELSGSFRIMSISVSAKSVKIQLESNKTGTIRARGSSLKDVISGMLTQIQDQSIE